MSATHSLCRDRARWRCRSSAWTATTPSCSRSCSARSAPSPRAPRSRSARTSRTSRPTSRPTARPTRPSASPPAPTRWRCRCARWASGAGHEVIVPGNTFIATAEAVSIAGATPRFVDVDPVTGLITAEIVERAITPQGEGRHAGAPLRRDRGHGPAAGGRSRGADRRRRGRLPGSRRPLPRPPRRARWATSAASASTRPRTWARGATAAAWSPTGPSWPTACACCARTASARATGTAMVGTTARLDALQAAILRVKLRHLDGWNAHRRRAAAELRRALQGTCVKTPAGPVDGGDHVYHLFVVRTDDRDLLRAHLTAQRHRVGRALPGARAPHGGLRAARLRARARCRSPRRWPSRSARCRSSPASTTTRSAPSPRRWRT